MITHPKCRDCKHSKSKHGTIIVSQYAGWHKRRKLLEIPSCADCKKFIDYGPTYEWEYSIEITEDNPFPVNNRHTYRPDNLGYLEYKSEKFDRLHKKAEEAIS